MDRRQQQRRNELLTELRRGLDTKLQKTLQPDARKHLEKAFALAQEPEPLEAPWPQITAYRLAHVLMRDGMATEWDRVDDLLQQAAQGEMLGPVPLIYRLIALSKHDPGGAPTEEMCQVYRDAQAMLATVDRLGETARQYVGDQRPLQSQWLNLLEAVVYMTGLDYDPIAGRVGADPFAGLGFESSGWRVVEDADSAQGLYPEAIARKVFENKSREAGRDVLAVEVAAGRRPCVIEHHPQKQDVVQGSLTKQEAEDFLSLVLGDRRRLRLDQPSDAVRQRKLRLRKSLKKVVDSLTDEAFNAWWENPRSDRRPPDLTYVILLIEPQAWADSGRAGRMSR